MKTLIIITEGNVAMGLGHVQRMLGLANLLRARAQLRVVFATRSEKAVRERIEAAGHEVLAVDGSYEQALKTLPPADGIVIDKLHVEEPLAAWVKTHTSARLVIVGNVSEANRHAHVVVNAIIGTRFVNARRIDAATGTLFLEGPRYVMLRDEFCSRRRSYRRPHELKNVLLLFGGTDPSNLTARAARSLLHSAATYRLTICLGPLFPHVESVAELTNLAAERGRQLTVVRNSNAVWMLMLDNDFLITAPGNTLFEAFCLGLPAIAFCQNESQTEMFSGFAMTHEQEQIARVEELMRQAYDDFPAYQTLIDALDVGGGRDEIVAAILNETGIDAEAFPKQPDAGKRVLQ